ncbi:DEAD-box ATP-dependent RNA helicase 20-like [Contarinia nasturtii]|uniref:DEAD-box ATP-dependent RNA helicase 20-like n=1 Tax=Contarinia nasturtii TaxID=265458 RepID=UPI0012D3F9C4|nr:DEAD-box ATP-dependent RNA helicase 20-like [Contarinia nasturtii]
MLLAKRSPLFLSIKFNEFSGLHATVSSQIIRKFASRNSNNRNKNRPQITVTAKNEFVTHKLNSSIATHLKRQQKLWNDFQKDEQREYQMRETDYYLNKNTGKLEHTRPHKMGKNIESKKQVTTVSDEAESDEDDLSDCDSDDCSLDDLETPNWDDMKLVEINKNFYKPSELTQSRSQVEISNFKSKMHIKLGSIDHYSAPKPIFQFSELSDLSQKIVAKLDDNFHEFTPFQSQAIPLALSGANMIATSQPRTGKTLAMLLSAIIHISYQPRLKPDEGPVAVILTLTEEMAEQIQQLANIFCNDAKIKCTVVCDDINQTQTHIKPIDVGELLITTPYHLYEILRTKSISMERCSHFALYEADKMLHMCLDDEILQIESQIRPDCQRLIWSSMWTSELKKLIIDDHVRLDVGSSEVEQNLENIKQIVKLSDEKQKEALLIDVIDLILSESVKQKILIFTDTPNKADKIAKILQTKGYHSKSLHNRKSTTQQNAILFEFQSEAFQFLILTDLAAKNINFGNISHVVNCDMPLSISDYVNRVSRTNRPGTSYSIVTEEDGDLVDDLIATLQNAHQSIPPPLFILKAANASPDHEIKFAVPKGKGFQKFTIDNNQSDDVKERE